MDEAVHCHSSRLTHEPEEAEDADARPRTPHQLDAAIDRLLEQQTALLAAVDEALREARQARRLLELRATQEVAEHAARLSRDDALLSIMADLMGRMGKAGIL